MRLAWDGRFREQEDVLKWPQELLPDFIAAVEPLKPIEAKVEFPTPPNQELKMEFRNRYRDYIRKELPKLAEIIGSEWRVGVSSSVRLSRHGIRRWHVPRCGGRHAPRDGRHDGSRCHVGTVGHGQWRRLSRNGWPISDEVRSRLRRLVPDSAARTRVRSSWNGMSATRGHCRRRA